MTTKVYLVVIVFISVLLCWFIWQNGEYKEEIQLLTLSNGSLISEVEKLKKKNDSQEEQNKKLVQSNQEYMQAIQRNKTIIDSSKHKDLDRNKVVDDETTAKIIDVLNNSFTYGL